MTSGNAGSGAGGGTEQEQSGSIGEFEQLSKEEKIKRLSGGAGIDPLTNTVGGPDSPSGVSLTEGGAVGTPLAHQQQDPEKERSNQDQEDRERRRSA